MPEPLRPSEDLPPLRVPPETMRHVLIAAFGSVGDVLPFIRVGGELTKRGHDVTLISNPYFEPHAKNAGVALCAVGTLEQFHALATDSGVFHWKTAFERVVPHFVHVVEATYETTIRMYRPGQTVLFGGPGSLGARIAQEQNRIPLAFGLVSPSRLPSRYDPPHPPRPLPPWAAPLALSRRGIGLLYLLLFAKRRLSRLWGSPPRDLPSPNPLLDEVNRVRIRAQLPVMGGLTEWPLPAQTIVCMWPDWFAAPQPDWPRNTVVTGFPYEPPGRGEPASEAGRSIGAGARGPLLVFTTGSVASQQHAFFVAALEACRILKRPGLFVTPHADQIPQPLPSDVTHVAHAPFAELFARSALVVHHGGIGTIALALAAGVPQIIRPMMGEQFDLGNRVQRLGVGRMLAADSIPPAQLARAIESLIGSERVANACRRWQAKVDFREGLEKAADSIERLAMVPSAPPRFTPSPERTHDSSPPAVDPDEPALLPVSPVGSQSRGPTSS